MTQTNIAPTPQEPPAITPAVGRSGKVRPAILLWALGVPIPFILVFFLIRGCMS